MRPRGPGSSFHWFFRPRLALAAGVLAILATAGFLWPPRLSGESGASALERRRAAEIVREVLDGGAVPRVDRATFLGRRARVHVSVFDDGERARATAFERDIGASLVRAATEIRASLGDHPPSSQAWIKIDLETAEAPMPDRDSPGAFERGFEPGLDGVRAELADGRIAGIVLPSDPISGAWFTRSEHRELKVGAAQLPWTRGAMALVERSVAEARLRAAISADPRAGLPSEARVRFVRFRTDALLARMGGGDPIRLHRGHPARPATPSQDAIRDAVHRGVEHLAADVGADGRFVRYAWLPALDQADAHDPYNLTRHIAATWVLEKLGRRFREPRWIDAGDRALGYVSAGFRRTARTENGVPVFDLLLPGGGHGGLGEIATATLALEAKGASLTAGEREAMDGFGAALEWMLRDDGGFFEDEAQATARAVPPKDRLLYEPGEALLALVTLARLEPEHPHWLASARRAADYQRGCFEDSWRGRDCWGALAAFPPDARALARVPAWWQTQFVDRMHWDLQAFDALARLTGEKRWAETGLRLGEAMLMTLDPPNEFVLDPSGLYAGPSDADELGSFPMRGAPTELWGSRLEAIAAARRAAAFAGRDTAGFDTALLLMAGFAMRNQYDAESCWFCRHAGHVDGAFRAGLIDTQTRIDYGQHATSGLADILEWYGGSEAASASRPDR